MIRLINNKKSGSFINILVIGLFAGTLDALAAILTNYKIKAALVFEFIASAVFGKAAFTGGSIMVICGVVFHYCIAFVFTTFFFVAFPYVMEVIKNKYLVGILYGTITWLIMNLLVVPYSRIGSGHIPPLAIATGIAILIICIGLPVAIISDRIYSKAKK